MLAKDISEGAYYCQGYHCKDCHDPSAFECVAYITGVAPFFSVRRIVSFPDLGRDLNLYGLPFVDESDNAVFRACHGTDAFVAKPVSFRVIHRI